MQGETRTRLGVAASISASLLFVVVFVLSASLDFTGNEFFGWRTLFTVAMLVVFLSATRRWVGVRCAVALCIHMQSGCAAHGETSGRGPTPLITARAPVSWGTRPSTYIRT